jgi:hypothetical protein
LEEEIKTTVKNNGNSSDIDIDTQNEIIGEVACNNSTADRVVDNGDKTGPTNQIGDTGAILDDEEFCPSDNGVVVFDVDGARDLVGKDNRSEA